MDGLLCPFLSVSVIQDRDDSQWGLGVGSEGGIAPVATISREHEVPEGYLDSFNSFISPMSIAQLENNIFPNCFQN